MYHTQYYFLLLFVGRALLVPRYGSRTICWFCRRIILLFHSVISRQLVTLDWHTTRECMKYLSENDNTEEYCSELSEICGFCYSYSYNCLTRSTESSAKADYAEAKNSP